MGMKSIAEFEESKDIMTAVRKLSVEYAQGYTVGKPEPFIDCPPHTTGAGFGGKLR